MTPARVDAADIDAVAEGLAGRRVAVTVHGERTASWDHTKLGAS